MGDFTLLNFNDPILSLIDDIGLNARFNWTWSLLWMFFSLLINAFGSWQWVPIFFSFTGDFLAFFVLKLLSEGASKPAKLVRGVLFWRDLWLTSLLLDLIFFADLDRLQDWLKLFFGLFYLFSRFFFLLKSCFQVFLTERPYSLKLSHSEMCLVALIGSCFFLFFPWNWIWLSVFVFDREEWSAEWEFI